jgi:hypothetical protein
LRHARLGIGVAFQAFPQVHRRSSCGAPVSSSFLFVGIVAVWAFFLVPRWLRRHHAQPQVEVDVEVDVEFAADYHADDRTYAAYPSDGYADETPPEAGAAHEHQARTSARPRSRALRTRRRLLTMLVLLSAVAAACTALKLTSWWVCIPPAGMLGIYLLLLREAAVADAEQARRRAAMELRVQAARQRAQFDAMEYDAQPSAQIIDISARVGDQLYDQYADATVRAVGD